MVIVKRGSIWYLYTKDKKRVLGKFKTKKDAVKRKRQVNYFKHSKK